MLLQIFICLLDEIQNLQTFSKKNVLIPPIHITCLFTCIIKRIVNLFYLSQLRTNLNQFTNDKDIFETKFKIRSNLLNFPQLRGIIGLFSGLNYKSIYLKYLVSLSNIHLVNNLLKKSNEKIINYLFSNLIIALVNDPIISYCNTCLNKLS